MPVAEPSRCRLCLVTPPGADPATFPRLLGAALSGGDVASLIVTAPAGGLSLQDFAAPLVPIAQARGVAVLIHNDTQVAGRVRADGVHVDTSPADVAAAVAAFKGKRIVGAGNLRSRHDAMTAGEAQPDYVFFGRLDGDREAAIHPPVLDLAAWWSDLFVIPAVVMGGSAVASVSEALEAGIEFVALSDAVFRHPDPAAAIAEANALLARTPEPAA